MELSEREWDVVRAALDDYVRGGETAGSWNSFNDRTVVRAQKVSIARDLYFRFSHEPV